MSVRLKQTPHRLFSALVGLFLIAGCIEQNNAESVPETAVKTEVAKASGEYADIKAAISAKLGQSRPDIQVVSVSASPIDGLYEVELNGGPMVYFSADGNHFIAGDMFAVQQTGIVNLGDQRRSKQRAELMASVAKKDMIIFAPKKETKAVINVFTDIDCGYCQKLHREVPELNKYGVEVRYLAYPRAGVGSPSYNKIATAWCAKDPNDALTKLKNRQSLPNNVCKDNPVAAQFELGSRMGVRGTPALITEDGQLIPGYQPAKALAKALGVL